MHTSRTITTVAATLFVLGSLAGSALAQAPVPRMSDQDVKALMEQVDKGVGRFIDGMDPQMRTAVIRGDAGEFDMKVLLKDFRDAIAKMRDRYKPPAYSAGAETVDVLRRAKGLDAGIGLRPGMSGADAKWSDVVPLFSKLAGAYLIDWNTDRTSWVAGRVSDGDLKTASASLKKTAGKYSKDLGNIVKKDKTLDAAGRKTATDAAAALTAAVKGVDDLVKQGADATSAVQRLASAAGEMKRVADAYAGAGPLAGQWAQAQAAIDTIKKAYQLPR